MYEMCYNIIDRGKDVKNYCLIKNGAMPLFSDLRRMLIAEVTTLAVGFRFSIEKGNP